ncbi:MAG: type II toxin-antitoxin system RelE/ParE family toxin [Pseudomonadota bacterium]
MISTASARKWVVRFDDEFEAKDFGKFSDDEKDALLTAAKALAIAGPRTGRPHVDTLSGSKHSNMKELRYDSLDGTQVWRAAFAFDPNQEAIILCAADKQGTSQVKFYRTLIAKADRRFDSHLQKIEDTRRQTGAKVKSAKSKRNN